MFSGALSSSRSTGSWWILWIGRTFNIWVYPPGRSFADNAGGKGDFSDNVNAGAPWYWNSDLEAFTISSMSKMYPMAVLYMFWTQDSFWKKSRFWLPCHIFRRSWTLALPWHWLSSASFFISESFSVFVVSNSGSSRAKIPLLVWAIYLTMMFSQRVLVVVINCLQPIISQSREKLVSTPTRFGMIENMSCATLERSAYIEGDSSCHRQQLVISSIQNVLLNSIGSQW